MIKMVIGAGFGDEGKGKSVSTLCSEAPDSIVIKCNGTQQAGHTVVDKHRFIFSHFGSGTLQGVPTFITKQCSIYPKTLLAELLGLKTLGITPKLYIDPLTKITTPYDILKNQISSNGKQNTCGLGVNATREREAKHFTLHYADLFTPKLFEEKLKAIKEYYNYSSRSFTTDFKDLLSIFINCVAYIRNNNIGNYLETINWSLYENIIFELGQGLLLDPNIGVFPYTTSSNTGSKNPLAIIDQFKLRDYHPELIDVYYVSRAYLTRHGDGPLLTNTSQNLNALTDDTNVYNVHQGSFRYGLLNVDLLKTAIVSDKSEHKRNSAKFNLVITHTDEVEKTFEILYNNVIQNVSMSDLINLLHGSVDNIYLSNSPNNGFVCANI